jgi:hypothetical protein
VESINYSYSFDTEVEQEWDWSERDVTQPEILQDANHVVDRFDLKRHVTSDADHRRDVRRLVTALVDHDRSWRLRRSGHFITAVGRLSTSKP